MREFGKIVVRNYFKIITYYNFWNKKLHHVYALQQPVFHNYFRSMWKNSMLIKGKNSTKMTQQKSYWPIEKLNKIRI